MPIEGKQQSGHASSDRKGQMAEPDEETWLRVLRKRQKQIDKERRRAEREVHHQQQQRQPEPQTEPASARSSARGGHDPAQDNTKKQRFSLHVPDRAHRVDTALWAVLVDIATTVGRLFTLFYSPLIWCISMCVFCSVTIYLTKDGYGRVAKTVTDPLRTTTRSPGAQTATTGGVATPLALFPEGGDMRRDVNYLRAVHSIDIDIDINNNNNGVRHRPDDPFLRLIDHVFRTPTWNEHWTKLSNITAGIMAHGQDHTARLFEQLQQDLRAAIALQRNMHDNPAAVLGRKARQGGFLSLFWAFFGEMPDRITCGLGLGGDKGCGSVQRTVLRRIDAFYRMVAEAKASRRAATLLAHSVDDWMSQLHTGLCQANQRIEAVTAFWDEERRLFLSDGGDSHAAIGSGLKAQDGPGLVRGDAAAGPASLQTMTLRLRAWLAASFYLCKQSSMAADWLDARWEVIGAEEEQLRRQQRAAVMLRTRAVAAGRSKEEAVWIEHELEVMLREFLGGLEGHLSEK
ncbi:hypothetical protein Ct61P_15096 [Colletotrichum tofieldiae]|nr:hypothetical protein Ct61P_15096 [Colletotrichum tofieldiae]